MCVLARITAVVTALCFLGSSTLSAMPLVWCIGNDGHRAVEAILHQHAAPAMDAAGHEGLRTSVHDEPCSDWQLLGAAGAPHAKSGDGSPKSFMVVVAFPPLKLVIAQSAPTPQIAGAAPRPPVPQAHLRALRSVVLLI